MQPATSTSPSPFSPPASTPPSASTSRPRARSTCSTSKLSRPSSPTLIASFDGLVNALLETSLGAVARIREFEAETPRGGLYQTTEQVVQDLIRCEF
ncbi:hypothetical protein CTA1_2805 [Colletotrichum tanaceti]|uniref:Uncharacterized protein n=1 Tax=Colletotrichum tanaceti TaxID=1306861 RepID=A0A4U6XCY0_9PEZI|nr:hypothetical protein CTA1_2805 [Colletotrichum tanaceti]